MGFVPGGLRWFKCNWQVLWPARAFLTPRILLMFDEFPHSTLVSTIFSSLSSHLFNSFPVFHSSAHHLFALISPLLSSSLSSVIFMISLSWDTLSSEYRSSWVRSTAGNKRWFLKRFVLTYKYVNLNVCQQTAFIFTETIYLLELVLKSRLNTFCRDRLLYCVAEVRLHVGGFVLNLRHLLFEIHTHSLKVP